MSNLQRYVQLGCLLPMEITLGQNQNETTKMCNFVYTSMLKLKLKHCLSLRFCGSEYSK